MSIVTHTKIIDKKCFHKDFQLFDKYFNNYNTNQIL